MTMSVFPSETKVTNAGASASAHIRGGNDV
jgi:hypothetical protein